MNKLLNYPTEGNSVRIEAPAESGRVQLQGTGTIHAFVSLDAVTYTEVQHEEAFTNGIAEFPIDAYIGDHLKFEADTLTSCKINWNMPPERR